LRPGTAPTAPLTGSAALPFLGRRFEPCCRRVLSALPRRGTNRSTQTNATAPAQQASATRRHPVSKRLQYTDRSAAFVCRHPFSAQAPPRNTPFTACTPMPLTIWALRLDAPGLLRPAVRYAPAGARHLLEARCRARPYSEPVSRYARPRRRFKWPVGNARPLRRSPCAGRPTGAARTAAGSGALSPAPTSRRGSYLTPASCRYSRWPKEHTESSPFTTRPNHRRLACPAGPAQGSVSTPARAPSVHFKRLSLTRRRERCVQCAAPLSFHGGRILSEALRFPSETAPPQGGVTVVQAGTVGSASLATRRSEWPLSAPRPRHLATVARHGRAVALRAPRRASTGHPPRTAGCLPQCRQTPSWPTAGALALWGRVCPAPLPRVGARPFRTPLLDRRRDQRGEYAPLIPCSRR